MNWLKYIHIGCAIISFSGFFIRGVWMLTGNSLLQKKWVKVSPHIVDTFLLLSAILLVINLGYPVMDTNWLLAKITALLVYIGLGMLAFKHATYRIRVTCWGLALLVFIYIVSAAVNKSELGFLAWF